MRPVFIDHVGVYVRDLAASRRFYEGALSPWGSQVVEYEPGVIGVGPPESEDLGLAEGEPTAPLHIAFAAPDRETVERFHAAALAAGGRDNGGPGERPHYHPGYYAAYVLDPDGNNVEAVYHGRPDEP